MADSKPIDFITTNPAVDAFQQGQKLAQETLLNDNRIEEGQRNNQEAKLTQGSRLRRVAANSDVDVAAAEVAKQTVPYKVQDAYNTSRTTGASADVAEGTVAPRIANSNNEARTTGANADVQVATAPDKIDQSEATTRTALGNADVNAATVPDRIKQSHDETRAGGARADSTEMMNFDKTLALIKAGDIDGARIYNERTGGKAPPELFANADVQKHMVDAWEKANEMYPDRPKERLSAMKGYLKHMSENASAGVPTTKADVYNIPGAPEPPEFAGKTNDHKSAEIQKVEWLIKNGVVKTPQEAWQLGHQTLQNPQSVYAQIYNNHVRTNGGDTVKAAKDTEDAVKLLRTLTPQPGGQPAAAAPAPAKTAAAPATLPAGVPPGSQFSPSRNMWRDPQGNIYGPDGTPARL